MANPRIIPMATKEYERLEAAAKLLEATSKNYFTYTVRETYFDYGQGWKWTTIICDDNSYNSWQVGSPRMWEMVITAETVADIAKAVEEIQAGKFFKDK